VGGIDEFNAYLQMKMKKVMMMIYYDDGDDDDNEYS